MTRLRLAVSVTIILSALWTATDAQVAFSRTYGGAYEEDGRWMEQMPDSGFILVGNTGTYSNFASDIWLVRTDLFGNVMWTRSFDGDLAYDFANFVKVTSDGGFIIAGFSTDTSGSFDGYVIRTDGLGNVIWRRKVGGPGLQEFEAIIQTSDGNFTAIGIDYGPNSAYYDNYLVRFDQSGNVLWTKTFGGASFEIGNSLQQTPDGGYVVTGGSYSYPVDSASSGDYILYKLDTAGNRVWQKTYTYPDLQEAHYVQNMPDGGFILVGDADGMPNTLGQTDILLIKTDSMGDVIWTKLLGGTKKDGGKTVEVTTDGGLLVGGISRSFGLSEPNYYMAKLDDQNNLEWQTYSYGTPQHDHLYRATECSDGGYAMFGYFRNASGDKNFALVKVGSDGGVSNDVGIDRFISPFNKLCRNFDVDISLQLTNFGQRNIFNVPVTVIIDDSLSQTILRDTLTGLLAPGETRELLFDETYDFLSNRPYQLTAYITHLVADISYSNDTSYLTVTMSEIPSPPTSIPSIRCSTGPLTVSAVPQGVNDSLFWFDEPTGGTLINWGEDYVTRNLSESDTFWVESRLGFGGTCGPIDNSIGAGAFSSGGSLRFDARQPFTIVSVKVLALGTGLRTVELLDGSGNVLQSRTFNLTAGWHRLYLDFQVPEQLDLELALTSNSEPLCRNSSGAVFPYKIGGVLEMFGGSPISGRYYYFYDWNIFVPNQQCVSNRIPAYALIGADSSGVFDRTVCDSGSVTLQVQSPDTVNWYDSVGTLLAAGPQFTTPLLTTSATYYLEVGACNRIPVQASVIPRSPDPFVAPVNNCGPGQVILEAISSDPVSWYDAPSGGNLFGTGLLFQTPYLDSASTFFAVAGTRCPSNAVQGSVTITGAPTPVVQEATACAPASVTLGAQAPDSLFWYTTPVGGTPFATGGVIVTPLLSNSVTYYVEANNGCASQRVPVTATLIDIPSPVSNSGTRCGAGNVVLSANSLYNITWWNDSVAGMQMGSGVLFTTDSLTTTTDFYVQADDGTCISPRTSVVATVNITDPPAVSGASRCGPGNVTLSATANEPLSWFALPSGGNTLANGSTFTPNITTDSTFWVSAGTSCPSVRVQADALLNDPASDPVTAPADACAPDSTVISAQPALATDSIRWFVSPGGQSLGTGTTLGIALPDSGFTYDTTFFAVAGEPGCESNPVPVVVHVDSRPPAPLVSAGSVCGPGSIILSAASLLPVSWYDNSGNLIAIGPSITANVTITTVFAVSANNGTCNSLPSQAVATVLQQPSPSISGPDTLIITPGQITVLSTVTNGGTAPYAYAWSPGGQTTSSINVTQPGNYYLVVTDANGCTGTDGTTVTVLTGLDGEALDDEVQLYPNPVHDKLYLRTRDGAPERISLMDITARIVYVSENQTYDSGVMAIDLREVPPGVYSLVLESKKGVTLRTIVVD